MTIEWDDPRLDEYHYAQRVDCLVRLTNDTEGRPLCRRCDGTGNEYFFTYKRCSACNGSGVKARRLEVYDQ